MAGALAKVQVRPQMDPYTPPPPIRTPKTRARELTDADRQKLITLLLAACGIFSLGAAVGSSGEMVFLLFCGMFFLLTYMAVQAIEREASA